jgi:hypothetical protein
MRVGTKKKPLVKSNMHFCPALLQAIHSAACWATGDTEISTNSGKMVVNKIMYVLLVVQLPA